MSHTTATRRTLLLALAGLPLAACGIRGPNKPPEDADPDYPRRYPAPDSVRPEGLRPPQPQAESRSHATAEDRDGTSQ